MLARRPRSRSCCPSLSRQARDSEERERWIRALEDTILRHNQPPRRSPGLRGRSSSQPSANSGPPPTVEEFDRKLGETDGYLELLLGQMSKLKERSESSGCEEVKQRCERVLAGAAEMAESVKHAIVLLQIAKNAAAPAEAGTDVVKVFQSTSVASESAMPPQIDSLVATAKGDEVDAPVVEVKNKVPVIIPATTSSVPLPPRVASSAALKAAAIPEVSYSSSEDDDDFFDAEDDEDSAGDEEDGIVLQASCHVQPLTLDLPQEPEEKEEEELKSPLTPSGEVIDYDALYLPDAEDSDVDMKSHGSVLTHLLSQVRIGMDLTKVVLPTFILERRSLLEMYSDFFAHPDLFVSIAEGATAEERMVRVLRWYLSSFHAGRKSSVAKKPYNPIIGETFRCHWRLGENEETRGGPSVAGCALPWTKYNDLTFVAEQVSPHPPISGFYAEHPGKKISVRTTLAIRNAICSSALGQRAHLHQIELPGHVHRRP